MIIIDNMLLLIIIPFVLYTCKNITEENAKQFGYVIGRNMFHVHSTCYNMYNTSTATDKSVVKNIYNCLHMFILSISEEYHKKLKIDLETKTTRDELEQDKLKTTRDE
jgi:hypothetical protein